MTPRAACATTPTPTSWWPGCATSRSRSSRCCRDPGRRAARAACPKWRYRLCRTAGEAHLKVSGSAVTEPDEGSRALPPGAGRRFLDSRGEVPAVPDNIMLIIRFHPVGGEDVSVVSEDFGGEREALEAIAQALD